MPRRAPRKRSLRGEVGHRGNGDTVFGLKSMTAGAATVSLALVLGSSTLSVAQNRRDNRAEQRTQRPSHPQSQPQGHHAGQWLRQYKDLPPQQQQKALENDSQFRSLPPERQQRLRERLQHFSSLPPERQQRILNRMETWEHLTPPQKQQARQLYAQLKSLRPERRQAVQSAISTLRAMPPEARQRAIESGRFSQFSPQERGLLTGISQLPLAPAEGENEQGPNE
jgi:uncharacterized protein DUF3106